MIWFQRKQIRRTLQFAIVLVGIVSLALVSVAPVFADGSTQPSALNPKGTNGDAIAALFNVVLAIAVVVFVIVEGLLLISAWRFRKKAGDTAEPTQIHGNTRLEIAWTIAPALIVITLFVLALQTLQSVAVPPAIASSDEVTVKVIGHQWWWEYQYPDLNITTATDLIIPAGKVVNLEITSADVIHSYWVPQLNGKTDAFPNRINHSWIKADQPGTFYGQCAELCGPSHANMRAVVIAMSQGDFDAWVQNQQAGPVAASGDAQKGEQVLLAGACIGCHTINGTAAQGKVGPNLTHVASRTAIAGGTLTNTPGNIKRWLKDPPAIKPGSLMPNLNLSDADIEALTAYLTSLK
jgi:cytochrome c oxidase subunit 2